MRKEGKRNSKDWTQVDVKKETRSKLNIRKEQMKCKTVDELINKLLRKKK